MELFSWDKDHFKLIFFFAFHHENTLLKRSVTERLKQRKPIKLSGFDPDDKQWLGLGALPMVSPILLSTHTPPQAKLCRSQCERLCPWKITKLNTECKNEIDLQTAGAAWEQQVWKQTQSGSSPCLARWISEKKAERTTLKGRGWNKATANQRPEAGESLDKVSSKGNALPGGVPVSLASNTKRERWKKEQFSHRIKKLKKNGELFKKDTIIN